MFTGIIEGVGLIESASPGSRERRFVIRPLFDMGAVIDGASIAINGVCLSVEEQTKTTFTVYASRETLNRTTLSHLPAGAHVNIEQALALGGRLDGHIVTGHIDCVATILAIETAGESLLLRVEFPPKWSRYVIPKGSVALDGISLTVNDCGENFLEVNIIPDSQKRTNLPAWSAGTAINMETDIIGKYVGHLLKPWQPESAITMDFLASNGFV